MSSATRPRPEDLRPAIELGRSNLRVEAAHIVNTVRAEAERTDAVVIAEGIETLKHAREAVAAGSGFSARPATRRPPSRHWV